MSDEKLNIAVAKALGWVKVLIPDGTPSGESDEYWCSGERNKREIHQRIEYWNPSEEMQCAFQIVEELRKRGLHLILNDTMSAYRARFFDASWSIDNWVRAPDAEKTVWEKTVPLAICRAALRALANLNRENVQLRVGKEGDDNCMSSMLEEVKKQRQRAEAAERWEELFCELDGTLDRHRKYDGTKQLETAAECLERILARLKRYEEALKKLDKDAPLFEPRLAEDESDNPVSCRAFGINKQSWRAGEIARAALREDAS